MFKESASGYRSSVKLLSNCKLQAIQQGLVDSNDPSHEKVFS